MDGTARRDAGLSETTVDRPALLAELAATVGAVAEDDLDAVVPVLRRHGVPLSFVEEAGEGDIRYRGSAEAVLDLLSGLGATDLSTARLMEGHLNAVQLVALYGAREQRARLLASLQRGVLFGVWGADGGEPVRIEGAADGTARLRGTKRYCSGVGALGEALVPVLDETGAVQLLLLDVGDPARADAGVWQQRGMRRTRSGTYDFTRLEVSLSDRIGGPGDYRREPFFVGGIWRCAAAQLGAIERLVALLAADLRESGRDAHPLQMQRLASAILAARTARLWISDTARRVERQGQPDPTESTETVVAHAAFARLATESAAREIIALVEAAIGLGASSLTHPVERVARDLSVYIRQANPDAALLQHGAVLARGLAS